jgi:hypothetical protein
MRSESLKYERTPAELEQVAVLWWPQDLREEVAKNSPNLLLRGTFSQFRKFLEDAPSNPSKFSHYVEQSPMGSNMLLKHLMVFNDYAGEPVQRLHAQRHNLFPNKSEGLSILWNMDEYSLDIDAFLDNPRTLNNTSLKIDGPSLAHPVEHSKLTTALSAVLAYGAFSTRPEVSEVLYRCDAATWFGKKKELASHFEQRYLDVNRSVGGAQSNSLGQILQRRVKTAIELRYKDFDEILTNGTVEISGDKMTSDILIRKGKKAIAIEVAFQETTNSVIERKGTDAHKRKELLNSKGIASVYVLDGIGNFQRQSAITKLCENSDCTVAFSDKEFDHLVQFIREWFK